MMYTENVFVLLVTPLVACMFCVRGKPRSIVAALIAGMCTCLLSSYVSSFFAQMNGLNAVQTAVEIAPAVEEVLKLLPLLFYLLVAEPDVKDVRQAFVFLAVGFATMESAFYLAESGLSDPTVLALRGLSTAMMHLVCGVVVGYGLTRAWEHSWLRAAATFGLLCLAMSYHDLFNLLAAAGGNATIAAVALPLATFAALVVLERARVE